MSQEVKVIYTCNVCGEAKDNIYSIRLYKTDKDESKFVLTDKTVSETGTHVCGDCITAIQEYVKSQITLKTQL